MSIINLNYDSKFDILYARLSNYSSSYGAEKDGIVTFYNIKTDVVTGMAIYDAKRRIQQGDIEISALPIPIDLNALPIQMLLHKPDSGFQCTLQLA